jgi:uncharacterized protein
MSGQVLNHFRSRRLGGKHFVTTDHGSHCLLSDSEFSRLKQGRIGGRLQKRLEEREIILNKGNIQEAALLLRKRYFYLFEGASLHIVIPTLRCQMKCVYCQASSRPEGEHGQDMDRATAQKTLEFIFSTPSPRLTIEFQGGEPLLNWDIVKYIIENADKRNASAQKALSTTIVTNMAQMDREKMEYLVSNNVAVCTSLDGPKELHDANRPLTGGSNHSQVIGWIKRLQQEYRKSGREPRVSALATITRRSLEMPERIVDEYVRLGLPTIHLRPLNRLGVAQQVWGSISYSSGQYMDFWKRAVSHILKLRKRGIQITERMAGIMLHKMTCQYDPNYLDMRNPCGAAIGQLAYNHNGDIYTCDEARMIGEDTFLIGNVHRDSYQEVVTGDKACSVVSASINDQYTCDSCAYKPYCGVCPVCNFAEQGSVVARIPETMHCKIRKGQFDWVVRENFINTRNTRSKRPSCHASQS